MPYEDRLAELKARAFFSAPARARTRAHINCEATGPTWQGYLDSLPPPNVRLEAEVATSKRTVTDLRDQLEKVKALLAEAKAQLAERAENKRMVKSAKDTASDLAVRVW